jgi:hypothetical protein
MRMPKVGDRVVCIDDESLGTVVYLTAGGSPEIKFADGSHGTYMLREFAELFRYSTPPAQEIVCSTGLCHYKPAAQQEPVFCDYCGGNDEDPQDHCMDCTRPRWEPVTQKLLNAQHPWLYESIWIAMKDGRVMTGHYAWMQGRYPDRFLVGDCASLWAFEATHVMPMNQPKHPAKLKELNT